MAPIVHGLESQYQERMTFHFLDVSDSTTIPARKALGFVSTPHFFVLTPTGAVVRQGHGVLPADSLRAWLDAALATPAQRP